MTPKGESMKTLRSMLFTTLAVLVTALGIITTQAPAQTSASLNATATVQAPLAVRAISDLVFGNVFAGGTKTVLSANGAAGGAGRWELTGEPNLGVSLTFTLPSQLTGAGTPIPISSFNAMLTGSPSFGVVSGTAYSGALGSSSSGSMVVNIGATIAPPVGSAGSYSASIVLTVAYL